MYNNTILDLLIKFHIFVDFVHILCKPGIFDFPWFFLLERIFHCIELKNLKRSSIFGKVVVLFFWKAKINFLYMYVLLLMYYFGIFWIFKSNLYRELYCICGETGRRFWAPVDPKFSFDHQSIWELNSESEIQWAKSKGDSRCKYIWKTDSFFKICWYGRETA